jgi:hypothetical protein
VIDLLPDVVAEGTRFVSANVGYEVVDGSKAPLECCGPDFMARKLPDLWAR